MNQATWDQDMEIRPQLSAAGRHDRTALTLLFGWIEKQKPVEEAGWQDFVESLRFQYFSKNLALLVELSSAQIAI